MAWAGRRRCAYRGRTTADPQTADRTRAFRAIQIGLMVLVPIVLALPVFPDVVVMTVVGSAGAGLVAPVIIVGTLLITNDRRRMPPGYTNQWWENVVLVVVGLVGLWAAYVLVTGLPDLLAAH